MILFMLKKTFWDGWDNLLTMAVWNLVIIASMIGGWFMLSATVNVNVTSFVQTLPSYFALVAVLAFVNIFIFAVNKVTLKISEWKGIKIIDFFKAIPSVVLDGAVFGAFVALLIIFLSVAFPFYYKMYRNGSMLGLFLLVFIFWTASITFLALQWYMPLKVQMKGGFLKTLKKCYIIYFDNANFSFFMFLYLIVQIIFSAIALLFTIHGIAGITLAYNNALRLRLFKYDWMEENPNLSPKEFKKVPWDELLAEEKNILGPRSLRSFFFAWT